MWRSIDTLRLTALVLTVPVTALWARALGPATGALLIATHATLVVFSSAWSARCESDDGVQPRLRWSRDRSTVSGSMLDTAVPIGFGLLGVLTVSLLVSNVWIGSGAILAGAAAVWLGRLPRRDRLARVELIAPVGLLAGPGLLFRMHAWQPAPAVAALDAGSGGPAELAHAVGTVVRPEVISTPALAATLLAAAVMLVAILLCLVRDRAADERDGFTTTVTRLGRSGGVVLAWAWVLAITLLAAIGVGAGWWAWPVAALAAWAAAATGACLTARRDELAVGAWWVGGTILSLWATLTV